MSNDDETHPWKREIWAARKEMNNLWGEMPAGLDKSATLLPSPGDHQSQRQRQWRVALHNQVINYASFVEAVGDELGDLFQAPVDTVPVPVSGTYDAGSTDMWGEYDTDDVLRNGIEWTQQPVTLGSIRREWHQRNSADITLRLDDGAVIETQRVEYYLPIRTVSAVFTQVDRCIRELNWLPERVPDRNASGEQDLPEHVKQGAPGYQQ